MEYVAQLHNAQIYQKDVQILHDVDLSISLSEFVYLIGKTGDGKSSLLKTMWAELPLTKGTGKMVGFDLAHLETESIPMLRRKIGMIFQDFHLFKDWTVADNLRFVLQATGWKDKKKIEHRMNEVLSRVNLLEKMPSMVYKLSGGEQQRVVIARAILNEPLLILADEPTGNLDPDTSDQILHLLRELAIQNDTAICMATHDYRIIEKFPGRVYQVANATVTELE